VRPHPIRLVLEDDLRRSRLTVFFRLLLGIPHYFWWNVWSFGAFFAVIANWFATLVTGRSPRALHDFLAGYVRYSTHVGAYVFLAGNPFPAFLGHPGSYPVDIEIDPPERQHRLVTLFRAFLALPALMIASLLGSPIAAGGGGIAVVLAFLIWFAALVLGRAPQGLRNGIVYAFRYSAQACGYLFLLTDRYPDSDPTLPRTAGTPPQPRPIRLVADEDPRRSRLTVFFRLLLALPHLVWVSLWGILAFLAAIVAWFATLVVGRLPGPLHRFLAAFLRYDIHLTAFIFLVANPFPGFTGREGSYPVDLEIDPPERQHRLVTAFRLLLGLPALMVSSALSYVLYLVAFLGWFAALVTGRMPLGLERLGLWAVRYTAEVYGYHLLLTDRYPYSSPQVEEREPEDEQLAFEAA
jgi:hypothetical protein